MMAAAPTRTARQDAITQMLLEHAVHSQAELLDLLQARGFRVTQATLSRDLGELGAERVRIDGQLVYALPGLGGDRTPVAAVSTQRLSERLRKVADDLVVSAVPSANLVVLRTPPGAANYVASAIDQARLTAVLGTIAGDDTIMIITAGKQASDEVVSLLLPSAPGAAIQPAGTSPSATPESPTTAP